jgi:hypothetical protein
VEFGKWHNFGLKARFQARPIPSSGRNPRKKKEKKKEGAEGERKEQDLFL